jgi:hypothetical protein
VGAPSVTLANSAVLVRRFRINQISRLLLREQLQKLRIIVRTAWLFILDDKYMLLFYTHSAMLCDNTPRVCLHTLIHSHTLEIHTLIHLCYTEIHSSIWEGDWQIIRCYTNCSSHDDLPWFYQSRHTCLP